MIDFARSTFRWKSHPFEEDPHYRYKGGFVGTPGDVYHVRFKIEAYGRVFQQSSGKEAEIFLGAPCQSEYTIADRNLFQIPSTEYRMAFSRDRELHISARPSTESERYDNRELARSFDEFEIELHRHGNGQSCTQVGEVVAATLDGHLLNAQTRYRDRGFEVALEFPVNLINANQEPEQFQVCTGPVLLPDLGSWNGDQPSRVFVAQVALSSFDHVEFILRRRVEVAPSECTWLDRPRGRDRLELFDSSHPPPGYPPPRPRPTVYNETWEFAADNAVLSTTD